MVIIILLILYFCFLYISFLKKRHKKHLIIKKTYNKKLKIKNKLLFYNLTKFERNLLKKIKNNFVYLKKCDEDVYEEIDNVEINKNYPTIKIDICECKNYLKLNKYLSAIKKFENMNFKLNVFILFSKSNNFFYRDILYICSKYKLKSVLKIIDEEFLSVKLMSLINILDIDREVERRVDVENTHFEVFDKKYEFKNEMYKNFSYTSNVATEKFFLSKIRTVDADENFLCEKFSIENLAKKILNLKFVYVLDVSSSQGQKYIKTNFFRFKNFIQVNDKKLYEMDTISFDDKILMKDKIVFIKNFKLKQNQNFEFLIVKSYKSFVNIDFKNLLSSNLSLITNKYLKLPKIRVLGPNIALNKLLNFHLPQELIKNYIFCDGKIREDFDKFLGDFSFLDLKYEDKYKNINHYFLPQTNLGLIYHNLMYNLIGLSFSNDCIYINRHRKNILGDTKVFLNFENFELCLDIKKTLKNDFSYTINGVEFLNIDRISYKTLIRNKNLVLHL